MAPKFFCAPCKFNEIFLRFCVLKLGNEPYLREIDCYVEIPVKREMNLCRPTQKVDFLNHPWLLQSPCNDKRRYLLWIAFDCSLGKRSSSTVSRWKTTRIQQNSSDWCCFVFCASSPSQYDKFAASFGFRMNRWCTYSFNFW